MKIDYVNYMINESKVNENNYKEHYYSYIDNINIIVVDHWWKYGYGGYFFYKTGSLL